jgi:hypothetical protein
MSESPSEGTKSKLTLIQILVMSFVFPLVLFFSHTGFELASKMWISAWNRGLNGSPPQFGGGVCSTEELDP